MRTQIENNHPGIYNRNDSEFHHILMQAYTKATATLYKCITKNQCKGALTDFIQAFDDPHLTILWHTENEACIPANTTPFTTEHVSNDIVWVRLPTFYNLSQTQEKQLQKSVEQIQKIQSGHLIFDLRGNKGGHPMAGRKILNALTSPTYAQKQRDRLNSPIIIQWRANQTIYNHVCMLTKVITDDALNKELSLIAQGIKQAIEKKQPLYSEQSLAAQASQEHAQAAPLLPHIYCITDSCNGSAVLDFLDELIYTAPNTTLIGKPTGYDRIYMELRIIQLPSMHGSLGHPVKFYNGRPRKDKERYSPDMRYPGNLNDTKALQTFVINYIKNKTTFVNSQ